MWEPLNLSVQSNTGPVTSFLDIDTPWHWTINGNHLRYYSAITKPTAARRYGARGRGGVSSQRLHSATYHFNGIVSGKPWSPWLSEQRCHYRQVNPLTAQFTKPPAGTISGECTLSRPFLPLMATYRSNGIVPGKLRSPWLCELRCESTKYQIDNLGTTPLWPHIPSHPLTQQTTNLPFPNL